MNNDINSTGRISRIVSILVSMVLLTSGLFIIIFANTGLFKGGPELSMDEYAQPNRYLNIRIKKISEPMGTSNQGKYHYYLISDEQNNLHLYEVNSIESENLTMDNALVGNKKDKIIKTIAMPYDFKTRLNSMLISENYETLNTETILSNYEYLSERTKLTISGIVPTLLGGLIWISTSRSRKNHAEVLAAFQEQFPDFYEIDRIKNEADMAIPTIGIYVMGDFIVSTHRGFHIANLKDTLWAYQHIQRYYFFVVNRALYFREYNRLRILPVKGNKNVVTEGITELFDYLYTSYPNMILGFNSDNLKRYKEIVKEFKENRRF